MSLLVNPPINGTSTDSEHINDQTVATKQSSELQIVTSKVLTETSSMSDELKSAVSKNAPDMTTLFERVLEQKGESLDALTKEGNRINANGLSPMTLHLFTLEAAKFGKTITYKEEKTIVISD